MLLRVRNAGGALGFLTGLKRPKKKEKRKSVRVPRKIRFKISDH